MGSINNNLKYYRGILELTRKELCEGICDTSTLFRIEKEEQVPRLDLLKRLSEKMEVPLEYLISGIEREDLHKIDKYKHLCRELIYTMDYSGLLIVIEDFEIIINKYKHEPEFITLERYIEWIKAIITHKYYGEPSKSLLMLKKIYKQKLRTSLDINICNSIGLIIMEKDGYNQSKSFFQKAFEAIKETHHQFDSTLLPRVGYNLAFCEFYRGNKHHAMSIGYMVMEYLEVNHLYYMYGKTKHMLGRIYEELGDKSQALTFLEHALYLFIIEGKKKYIDIAKKDINRIKNTLTVEHTD